jgi:hypothetical protein
MSKNSLIRRLRGKNYAVFSGKGEKKPALPAGMGIAVTGIGDFL